MINRKELNLETAEMVNGGDKCPDCRGKGRVLTTRREGKWAIPYYIPCNTCSGYGEI